MTERVPVTIKGKEKLVTELSRLKKIERPKIVQEIEEARAHGDLSENAEYHAAKEKQGHVEARIRMLEDQVGRAEVIDPSQMTDERVVFGVCVDVFDVQAEKEMSYQIVGEDEADINAGRVSVTAPLAKALIGKEVGDVVTVQAPGGRRELEISDIRIPDGD